MDARQQIGDALAGAPRTETGLIIPPHVAEDMERERAYQQGKEQARQQAEYGGPPNRAQRRAMRKRLPRSERIASTPRLPETALLDEQTAAALAELPTEERERLVRDALMLKGRDGG